MVYIEYEIQENGKAMVTFQHHKPELLTDEQKANGMLVEAIPEASQEDPTVNPVLYVNPETGKLWYEYVLRPLTDVERISVLEAENAALKEETGKLNRSNNENTQILSELVDMLVVQGVL